VAPYFRRQSFELIQVPPGYQDLRTFSSKASGDHLAHVVACGGAEYDRTLAFETSHGRIVLP